MDITTISGIPMMTEETTMETTDNFDDILKLDLKMKKKKRSKNRVFEEDTPNDKTLLSNSVIHQSDTYTYEFLLDRAFKQIYNNHPELTQRPSKIHLPPPEVAREGTKKTVVCNFSKLCKELNRDKEHVMSFILTELCANGSIDGNERFIIRGKYPPSAIERIAKKYISEYVLCHSCKGLDTFIEKDKTTRLSFLKCNMCGSSVSIKPIVQGYRAKT